MSEPVRDEVPIDTGELYAELRARGFDHGVAIRSLNYVLGVLAPIGRRTPTDLTPR